MTSPECSPLGSQAAASVSAREQLLECFEAHSPQAAPEHVGDSPEHDDPRLQFLSVFTWIDGSVLFGLRATSEQKSLEASAGSF